MHAVDKIESLQKTDRQVFDDIAHLIKLVREEG
jgi:hypothetical protein